MIPGRHRVLCQTTSAARPSPCGQWRHAQRAAYPDPQCRNAGYRGRYGGRAQGQGQRTGAVSAAPPEPERALSLRPATHRASALRSRSRFTSRRWELKVGRPRRASLWRRNGLFRALARDAVHPQRNAARRDGRLVYAVLKTGDRPRFFGHQRRFRRQTVVCPRLLDKWPGRGGRALPTSCSRFATALPAALVRAQVGAWAQACAPCAS